MKALSKRLRWVGRMINIERMLLRKPEGRDHLQDIGVDMRLILKLVLKK
jgi:hypothetical protein